MLINARLLFFNATTNALTERSLGMLERTNAVIYEIHNGDIYKVVNSKPNGFRQLETIR